MSGGTLWGYEGGKKKKEKEKEKKRKERKKDKKKKKKAGRQFIFAAGGGSDLISEGTAHWVLCWNMTTDLWARFFCIFLEFLSALN